MHRITHCSAVAALALVVCGAFPQTPGPGPSQGRILHLAELNTAQIRALSRDRTVVLIPGGILEEHGPYLPSYTDGYWNERLTQDLATAIAARPGWTAVIFPVVPLGAHGANAIGDRHSFPGTYMVRPATLRAVFMDLAAQFGDQGFRWIFVIHGHGGLSHNRALDEAGDYFRDTYDGHMVHLLGLRPSPLAVDAVVESKVPQAQRAEDGFSVHAGLVEHSAIMALRPDLVASSVAQAPSVTGRDFSDLRRIAASPDWRGYFGAPRHANSELGRHLVEAENKQYITIALRILDGLDERQVPRLVALKAQNPDIASVTRAAEAHDTAEEHRQRQWLARRAPR